LRIFAEHLKHTCRDSDLFARLGGDEFVMLLANTFRGLVEQAISRLARSIESYNDDAG